MGYKIHRRLAIPVLAAFAACLTMSAQNAGQTDSLVRLVNANSVELIEKYGTNYRKTVDATFLHNGTYLICDTALWNVESKTINCWGHVRLLQDETELTSEKLDYFVDEDRAEFRGDVVQLKNRENNILRTRNLDYNTRDSIAYFRGGAAMRDKDRQVIESVEGTYESSRKYFTFRNQVNMYSDSVFVKTSLLDYDANANVAYFKAYIDFWNDGNMLSAGSGWYDRQGETFFFTNGVHGLTESQEGWCDTLYFYRAPRNVLMLGCSQVQDTSRHVTGLAHRIFYQDTLSRITMSRDAAVALETGQEEKVDTIYFGADTLVYHTVRKCDVPESELRDAGERLSEIHTDPVAEYRRQAAEAAAKAAKEAEEEAMKKDLNLAGRRAAEEKAAKTESDAAGDAGAAGAGAGDSAAADSVAVTAATAAADSLAAVAQDSLAVKELPDTTRIGFVLGRGNVRIYRKDIQVRCDSMRYCDLDSIARFYKDPVIWNDGNRQYSADSLSVLVRNGGIDRASLMSNAFIITQEDSTLFDQIKAVEVLAYFDENSELCRFDALGGASALFHLKEDEVFATVNKVESKMLYATMKNGEVERVHYFDSPKNDAYPRAQLPKSEFRMKGFNWQPELRPEGREDITSLSIRPSQRDYYEGRPKAVFKQTDLYFPGYMAGIYKALEESSARKKAAKESSGQETAPSDSLNLAGEAFAADSLAGAAPQVDSLASESAYILGAASADSLAVPVVLSEKELRAKEREEKKEARELARQMRIARRDARWEELDARDAAKAAAKEQKKLERKREKARKALEYQRRQEEREAARLQRYVGRFERRKQKENNRQKPIANHEQEQSEPSGERPQGAEIRGSLQTASES